LVPNGTFGGLGEKWKGEYDMDEGKIGKVMHEFKHGSLESSAGNKVKSRAQALAIGYSEANKK
jgi:Family of unknown function (DUF6496)